jgi:hypothetical protein
MLQVQSHFFRRLVPATRLLISRKSSDAPKNPPGVPKSSLALRNTPVSALNRFSPLDWSSLSTLVHSFKLTGPIEIGSVSLLPFL